MSCFHCYDAVNVLKFTFDQEIIIAHNWETELLKNIRHYDCARYTGLIFEADEKQPLGSSRPLLHDNVSCDPDDCSISLVGQINGPRYLHGIQFGAAVAHRMPSGGQAHPVIVCDQPFFDGHSRQGRALVVVFNLPQQWSGIFCRSRHLPKRIAPVRSAVELIKCADLRQSAEFSFLQFGHSELEFIDGLEDAHLPAFNDGRAGFSYPDWKGIVYPPDLKKRKIHPLEYLAQFFDCCEINTSFYGHIRPNVGKDWCQKAAAVNPEFQFTAKLFQGFTHVPRGSRPTSPFNLTVKPEEEKLAREGLDSIANESRLGAVLIQFPISFKNADDTRDYLFALIGKFTQYPLVLEIRHESWNDPDILARLTDQGVGFCNIDQPRLVKSISSTEHVTSPVGYVRLHGRNYKE